MSDLFCPATLILACHGERQASALADRLRSRNIAAVYSSESPGAVRTAEIAARALDLEVQTRAGLARPADTDPGGEVVSVLRPVIEEISDLYRGETVLVIADGDLIRRGVQAIARLAPGVQPARIQHGGTVEIQVDADGVVCTEWDARP